MNEKKARFYIVTAKDVVNTGKLSWQFLFQSKLDYPMCREISAGNWGHLTDDETDVLINIFNSNNKLILGWGNDSVDKTWIAELIKEMPSCALLMKKEYADVFKEQCEDLGYEFNYHYCEDILKTWS
jgi:hypothetical protein